MPLNNKIYSVDQLGSITPDGFDAALFPQIRDALVRKFKDIYGNDIDVSTASADGQYVSMEALVLNNVYRLLETLNKNLSPASASGRYLDIICSLANTFRQSPTRSTVQLMIKNSGSSASPATLTCEDVNGNRWVWINPVNASGNTTVTLAGGNAVTTLTFTCTEAGAITASGTGADPSWTAGAAHGDVCKLVGAASTYAAHQKVNAVPGKTYETDQQLRSRRMKSLGLGAQTTLASMTAKLLALDAIDDAYVFNNAGTVASTAWGVSTPAHNVMIAVRPHAGITIPDYTIASTIYSAITPGVSTQFYQIGTNPTYGTIKSYAITAAGGYTTTVYWKEATPIHPKITISCKDTSHSVYTMTANQQNVIKQAILNYLNILPLSGQINTTNLMNVIQAVDLKDPLTGAATYQIQSATIYEPGSISQTTTNPYQLPLTYCDYMASDISFAAVPGSTTGKFVITLLRP